MPWYTHKRQPASSWRGCHLSWHWPPGVPSQPTNITNITIGASPPSHPYQETGRHQQLTSLQWQGFGTWKARHHCCRILVDCHFCFGLSIDGGSWLVGWLVHGDHSCFFPLVTTPKSCWNLMSWTYNCLTNLLTPRSVLGFRCPQPIICKAWFNKNSFKTPGRSQLPTTVRAMIYQMRLTVLQLFQPVLELWSQGFRCAGGIIQV